MKISTLATLALGITNISAGAAIYVVLTVFITISVLSVAFIVLLFTVKGFRDLFFKPEKTKRTPRKKSNDTAPRASAHRTDSAAASAYSKTQSHKNNGYDADGVPTVPLGGIVNDAGHSPRMQNALDSGPHTLDNVPTVVLGGAPSPSPATEKTPSHEVAASIRRERAAAKSASAQTKQPKTASAKTPAGATKPKNTDAAKRTTKK